MGTTGSGKSNLAIDLASHFPIEIINADSMQVYWSLDVLTNKVPLADQRADHDILARKCLPVIVGGTNYYIQALVSPFLLDDSAEDMDKSCLCGPPGKHFIPVEDSLNDSYELLKGIDPVAANRIHPNNHRKISHYLSLYTRFGVLPSKLFQGQAAEVHLTLCWIDMLNRG
ncbi:hypothetical protein L6164_018987 [Bauhinia variegata]|uniref:Uncharacterized protein n=1 Tax=Bauhinia variegata TaxID=167791 RepID=A0ACB9NEC0_BAUVA|nr:hypothetical protein L6164_018987 [Bauhinia variegata]